MSLFTSEAPKPYPVSDDLKALGRAFRDHGHSLHVVGGAVRDHLLGVESDDVDLATDASPQEMLRIFPHSIKTGIKHGTLTIPFRRKHYECTTYRIDGAYEDSRHPKSIDFTTNIHEDLKRRDFTINAMCADCRDGRIIDDFDGVGDIARKVVRAVGDPAERFHEDALRMMRAARFAARLDFTIDPETFSAIRLEASSISKVSVERVSSELVKMMECEHAGYALELLSDSGLLARILPELDALLKSDATMLRETIRRLRDNSIGASGDRLAIRLAMLLLPLGGPKACAVAKALRLPNRIAELVGTLVLTKLDERGYSALELKRLLRRIGAERVGLFLDFNRIVLSGDPAGDGAFREAESSIKAFLKAGEPLDLGDLSLRGGDLTALGFRGKDVGMALEMALEMVQADPRLNSDKSRLTQELLERVRKQGLDSGKV